MHKNQIWIALFATVLLVVLWFSGSTAYEVYHYLSRTGQTLPTRVDWNADKQNSDRYYLKGAFTYKVKDNVYTGETLLDGQSYRNPSAVESAIFANQKKKWTVWYSPYNPKNSTLKRVFPFKSCVYSLILWGIFLYFIWIGYSFRMQTHKMTAGGR